MIKFQSNIIFLLLLLTIPKMHFLRSTKIGVSVARYRAHNSSLCNKGMCLVFVLITKVKYTSSSFLSGIPVCLFCSSIKKQLLVFITFLLGLKLIFLRQHLKCKQLCLHNKSCIYLAYNSTTGTQSSVDYWKSLNVYQFFKCLHV